MKRGYHEKPFRRFAWAVVNSGGYILSETRSTRRELMDLHEKEFGGVKWPTLRKRYGLRIVWVEVRVINL